MFGRRKEIELAAKLDRLLAGERIEMPAGVLEEKVWQVLRLHELGVLKTKAERDTVRTLMSDISHQLKTPLASLKLHLDLANDPARTEDERFEFLTECGRQTEKIEWFLGAMLKVTRLESGLIAVKPIPADLVRTIKDAAASIERLAASKGLSVVENVPDSLTVSHDPLWTEEALCNVLDNAVKYTAEGRIVISLEQGPMYARVDIADTGIGMEPEEYAKVFSRFYRIRSQELRRVEGTGLGLTIAREILRLQGGNITVISEPGKGSTFSVFLQNC